MSSKNTVLLKNILSLVQTYNTEIGLQTYFRKPNELLETPQWWKLQKVEAMMRELNEQVQSIGVDLLKELNNTNMKEKAAQKAFEKELDND